MKVPPSFWAAALLVVAFAFLLVLCGCAHGKRETAPAASFAGVTRQAGDVSTTLGAAADDGLTALDRNARASEIVDFLAQETGRLLGQ